MSKLKELIDRLCPNGVPFKQLNELAALSRGKVYSKEYLRDNAGGYPVYSSQTANDGVLGMINTYDYDGEYLTWTTDGAYAGTIFHRKGCFSITNVCGLITLTSSEIILRFLYYWLSIEAPKHVYSGMGNPKLMSNQVAPILVPVPPIEVQEEIVKILDTFSAHAAELQAELQARKEQYEYYRNLLLSFNPSACGCGTDGEQGMKDITTWGGHSYKITWKTMGEICNKTKNIKWKDNPTKECLYIDLSSVDCETHGFSNQLTMINAKTAPSRAQQIVETNDVLFGTTRPTLMRFAIVPQKLNNNICSTGYAVLRANSEIVLPQFLYFILNTHRFYSFVENNQEGAGYPSISFSKLQSFSIPVPPIELQEKIVAILDRFETLVNDLTQGLPAEIAAVKEQYEYYRNKLLTFKQIA